MADKKLEEKLLSTDKVEKAIKEAIQDEIAEAKKPRKELVITDIKEAPKNKVFDIHSAFTVFNRLNKTESILNGIQVDSLFGLNTAKRKQLEAGEISEVTINDYHIEFLEYRK